MITLAAFVSRIFSKRRFKVYIEDVTLNPKTGKFVFVGPDGQPVKGILINDLNFPLTKDDLSQFLSGENPGETVQSISAKVKSALREKTEEKNLGENRSTKEELDELLSELQKDINELPPKPSLADLTTLYIGATATWDVYKIGCHGKMPGFNGRDPVPEHLQNLVKNASDLLEAIPLTDTNRMVILSFQRELMNICEDMQAYPGKQSIAARYTNPSFTP